jgi:murein DD-endopeptidase MepM/ murein hydrolase activator NlpD
MNTEITIDQTTDSIAIGPEEVEESEVEEAAVSLSLIDKLKLNPELFYVCIPDTLFNTPAYDKYQFWDSLDIHPYVSDLTRLKDTITLVLEDSINKYYHPIYGKINSDFGWRKWKYHYGIDVDLNTGDSLVAAFDGMVRIVKKSKSYGNVIVIRHDNGLETLYAHLSKINVEVNQRVKGGEFIGKGGNTGRSTGPHLHFEIRYLGGAFNPNDIIDFANGTLKSPTLNVDAAHFAYINEVRLVRYHTIRKGDTLGHIAMKYGTSVSRLCKLNKISKNTILRVGRKIRYT